MEAVADSHVRWILASEPGAVYRILVRWHEKNVPLQLNPSRLRRGHNRDDKAREQPCASAPRPIGGAGQRVPPKVGNTREIQASGSVARASVPGALPKARRHFACS